MDDTRTTARFAELYRDPSSGLSPCMAWTLFVTAGTLADIYGDESGWDLLEEELPPLAHQRADETWMARLV